MTALARKIVIDTATTEFATDVVAGLTATPKRLSPKYFYDSTGSALFERITELPEYYPTRREIGILNEHAGDIAGLIPPGAALIEFGSGSSTKTRILLSAAKTLAAYVPVDISAQFLHQQMAGLRREYPKVAMLPVAADFTKPFDLPDAGADDAARRLLPRFDHRQFRAARGGGVPAPRRPHPRPAARPSSSASIWSRTRRF